MVPELLDLVVVRRVDGHRFELRRIECDPDDHKGLLAHLRAIAWGEDRLSTRDDWLSDYEGEVYRAGKDSLEFRFSALGDQEGR